MSSFVGDLWKKVGELKMSVSGGSSGSAFPFIYNEQETITRIGPFLQFNGQDFESNPLRKEESVFRRVSVFSCKDRSGIPEAKRILKSLKTMRHPRMLRFISAKESESEVVVVTEWVEAFKMKCDDLEWQKWAKWSIKEVEEFLRGAGRENCIVKDNLWITASGEVKVALFNEYTNGNDVVLPEFTGKNDLIHLTETFDRLVTLSSGERASLIKKLCNSNQKERALPREFLKFLILPELVKSRKLISGQPGEISLEEVHFLFVKGRELIGGDDPGSVCDFMFLLSDFYCELLANGTNSVQLIGCLLDQMADGLCRLFTDKYAQDKIYPLVSALTSHPLPMIRESALKALQGLCETRLSERVIANEVLRVLARMQGDAEGSLRVKAIGVLSDTVWTRIPDGLKAKICGPAVSRALSDPYPPCKRAGLSLLRKGIALLPPQEIVSKLIPGVAGLLIEGDGGLRGEGFECMERVVLPTLKRAVIGGASAGSDKSAGSAGDNKSMSSKSSTPSVPSVSSIPSAASVPGDTSKKTPTIQSQTEMFNTTDQSTASKQQQPSTSSSTPSANTTSSKMKLGSIKKIV